MLVTCLIITKLSQFDTIFPIQLKGKIVVAYHQVRAIESWICFISRFTRSVFTIIVLNVFFVFISAQR